MPPTPAATPPWPSKRAKSEKSLGDLGQRQNDKFGFRARFKRHRLSPVLKTGDGGRAGQPGSGSLDKLGGFEPKNPGKFYRAA
jgi:hypothetical protein